jgi:hypothetical protein
MREVRSRSFFCPKKGKRVTLIEYEQWGPESEGVCGILSCSDQDSCATETDEKGEPVFPWGQCPACREIQDEDEQS